MNRVSKVLGVAVAGATMIGALAGCGNTTTTSSSNGGGSGLSGTVSLTVSGGSAEQAWLKAEQDKFAKANPNLKVTWKDVAIEEGDTGTKLITDPSSNPNVFMFASDQIGALVTHNAIGKLPADTVSAVKSANPDTMVNSVTYDGTLYGIPVFSNTWFMYYNKTMIKDPSSIDTMLKDATEPITAPFNKNSGFYTTGWFLGAGATIYGDGTSEKTAPKGWDNADVVKYLADLVTNKNFKVDDGQSGKAAFNNKQASMYFSGSWDAADEKKALGDDLGVAMPPSFTAGGQTNQLKAFAGSKSVGYNPAAGNTDTQKAAAAFAAFLGSKESQLDAYKKGLGIPTDNSLADNATIKADPIAQAQIDTINKASFLQPGWASMNNVVWAPVGAFADALGAGKITAANAADQATALQKNMVTGMTAASK